MLYKRAGSPYWQIKFTLGGKTVRRSSQTSDKKVAERIEHACREAIVAQSIDGAKEAFSWKDATDLWCKEKRNKRSLDTDIALFGLMDPTFKDLDITEITTKKIAGYASAVAARACENTANRHLALLRSLLKLLERREILDKAPHVEMYKVEAKEPVWVTPEQVKAVLALLTPQIKDIAEMAVLTGLRRSNVVDMQWAWVDLARRLVVVPAANAKGKKAIPVPLSASALDIVERRRDLDPCHVFADPQEGLPAYTTMRTAWCKAVKQVGIPSFRFHDLRHAWASFHMMNGTPDRVLQALGGWQSNKMLQVYAQLRPGETEKYAGNSNIF